MWQNGGVLVKNGSTIGFFFDFSPSVPGVFGGTLGDVWGSSGMFWDTFRAFADLRRSLGLQPGATTMVREGFLSIASCSSS